jgi:hypothetical protein
LRDTMTLYTDDQGWQDFRIKLNSAGCVSGCYFNPDSLLTGGSILDMPILNCNSSCPNILYNSTGKYGYAGLDSGISRQIKVTTIDNDNELKVTSTVTWQQGSGTYSITFSENLYNWVE